MALWWWRFRQDVFRAQKQENYHALVLRRSWWQKGSPEIKLQRCKACVKVCQIMIPSLILLNKLTSFFIFWKRTMVVNTPQSSCTLGPTCFILAPMTLVKTLQISHFSELTTETTKPGRVRLLHSQEQETCRFTFTWDTCLLKKWAYWATEEMHWVGGCWHNIRLNISWPSNNNLVWTCIKYTYIMNYI